MDFDKIRQKLANLQAQGKGGKKLIWKPKPGTQVIRMVPYVHNPEWPFLELSFYYDLAPRTIISPLNFNDPDPVQELADQLKSTGEKEDWLLARQLEAKVRTYVPVLVRGEESEGVKFWGFGKTVYEELLKTISDPDYGNILDLKSGSDITVEYEKPAEGYPKTTFRVKRNTSPATDSKEIAALLKEMPDVKDIWQPPTYDELKKILNDFIENNDQSSDHSDNSTDVETATVGEKAVDATSDIDAAFDEMFN